MKKLVVARDVTIRNISMERFIDTFASLANVIISQIYRASLASCFEQNFDNGMRMDEF